MPSRRQKSRVISVSRRSPARPSVPQQGRGERPVAEQRAVRAAELLQHALQRARFAIGLPARRSARDAGEREERGVEIGREGEAEMPVVVARVDDHGQVHSAQSVQAISKPSAPHLRSQNHDRPMSNSGTQFRKTRTVPSTTSTPPVSIVMDTRLHRETGAPEDPKQRNQVSHRQRAGRTDVDDQAEVQQTSDRAAEQAEREHAGRAPSSSTVRSAPHIGAVAFQHGHQPGGEIKRRIRIKQEGQPRIQHPDERIFPGSAPPFRIESGETEIRDQREAGDQHAQIGG